MRATMNMSQLEYLYIPEVPKEVTITHISRRETVREDGLGLMTKMSKSSMNQDQGLNALEAKTICVEAITNQHFQMTLVLVMDSLRDQLMLTCYFIKELTHMKISRNRRMKTKMQFNQSNSNNSGISITLMSQFTRGFGMKMVLS